MTRRARGLVELDPVTRARIDGFVEHARALGRAAGTVHGYRQALELVAEHVHPRPLLDITADDIEAFVDGMAAETAGNYRGRLRAFFAWAVETGAVDREPFPVVDPASRPRSNPHRAPDGRMQRRRAVGVELGGETRAVIGRYLDHGRRRGCRPGTITKQRDVMRLFAEHVHPRPLLDITADDIEAFLDRRRLAARARYHYVSMLAAFFRWAVTFGEAATDPTLTVVRPRFPRSIPRPIPDDELEHALAIAAPRERSMMALAAFHGLRAGEIANLQREDVLDRNDPPVIVVQEGKGGHQRVVPLHPGAWALIEPWLGSRRHGWLFPRESNPGRAMAPHAVSHAVNDLLHESGSASSLHSLRHFYGTKVYAASRDLRVTQALMGHASPNTTVGYVAWSSLDARDAVEAIKVPGSARR